MQYLCKVSYKKGVKVQFVSSFHPSRGWRSILGTVRGQSGTRDNVFEAEINFGGKRSSEKMQHDKKTLLNKETGEERG